MKQVMAKVEEFGRQEKVWLKTSAWNGATVTLLWSKIWHKLDRYLRSRSQRGSNTTTQQTNDKSRQGQMKWRTFYNNMQESGACAGNKVRKRKR